MTIRASARTTRTWRPRWPRRQIDDLAASSIGAGSRFGANVQGTGVPVAPGDLLRGWIDDTVQGIAFDPSIVTTANQLAYR